MSTEIRSRILDATEHLLGRLGYQKMSMEDIAQAAGVGRRTIYLHFDSKEEVALSTIDRIVDRLLVELQSLACSSATADMRLRRMLATRVLFRFDSVQDYHHNFNDLFATLRPAYLARRERYFASEATAFATVLTEGQTQGIFRAGDPQAVARTLLTMTNALLPYSLNTRELGSRDHIEAEVEAIADVVLAGLLQRPTSS